MPDLDRLSEVLVLEWDDFLRRWAHDWKQGEHVAALGPTGAGKTTLQVGLAQVSRFVVALDPKGGDHSLAASGWRRVTRWPLPHDIREDLKDNQPVRIILGKVVVTRRDRDANRALLAAAVPGLWEMGRWTVLVDDLQLLTDKRFMDVGDETEEMLIAARDKKLSVVSNFQRPSIGRTTSAAGPATDQATWVAVAYTRDDRVVQRLAEMLGRPAAECRGLIKALPKFCWALVGRDPRAPFIITKPPELVLPKGSGADAEQRRRNFFAAVYWGQAA